MNISQELAVDLGTEVTRCLNAQDIAMLKQNRLESAVVKAIRCLFAEAKLSVQVYTYSDIDTSDLLYIGNNLYDVGKFMLNIGLLPFSQRGTRHVIEWQQRRVLVTGQGERTLNKMRTVLCVDNTRTKEIENAYGSSHSFGYDDH